MTELITVGRLGKFKQLMMTLVDSLFARKTSVYTNTQIDTILSGYVNNASYDSNTGYIELKHDNTVIASVDASEFIVDGMVSSVEVTSENLIITFNTDSGQSSISIPLTDIFDPSNYYDKTASDARFQGKATVVQQTTSSAAISPNVLNQWGEIASLTITFTDGAAGELNEYMIQFTCPSNVGTTLTLPNTIKWANDDALDPEAGYTYQVSVVNNLAVYAGWEA